MDSITLPSPRIFTFLPLLLSQCILLQPQIPHQLSQQLRLALLPPTLYLTLTAPWKYKFHPPERCQALNAVLGILSLYASWKAIEWGVIRDGRDFEWVGYGGDRAKRDKVGDGGGPRWGEKSTTTSSKEKATSKSFLATLFDAIHLLTSMRLTGYRSSVVRSSSQTRLPLRRFLLSTLFTLLWSHTILISSTLLLSSPPSTRSSFLHNLFPALQPPHLHFITESTSYLAFALTAYSSILLISTLFTILSLSIHQILLLPSLPLPNDARPGAFDSRAYHPMFDLPFWPRNVKVYWSRQWHRLFNRSFRFLAWEPVEGLVRRMGGGRQVGNAMAAMAVFAMSAGAHEYGESSLSHT
ncbi:hypothetical protein P7C70_g6300, partial [Phenoliferia sp. Uapishka_3]